MVLKLFTDSIVNRKVYLDNAATTPLDERVFNKMLLFLRENFGNPSSIHSFGRTTRIAIEDARETIASIINADPGEIYFTSNGTEANNLAILGIAQAEEEDSDRKRILSTVAEHQCILEPLNHLGELGFDFTLLPVAKDTTLSGEILTQSLSPDTSLVSVIHYNNETGGINDIRELCSLAKKNNSFFHTDAVQSFGKTPIDVRELKVDSLSVSAHKFFGPKGAGFTFAKSGTPLSPMILGGSQERNRRGGTENPAAIIGMAEAAKLAVNSIEQNLEIVTKLKSRFVEYLLNSGIKNISLNVGDNYSPYIISLTFNSEYYNNDAEAMLMYLDINGVAASNGAACTSGTLKPSHVIMASGKSKKDASGTIRFSLSPLNTIDEIDYTCDILNKMAANFSL